MVHVSGVLSNSVHRFPAHAGWHCGTGEHDGLTVLVPVAVDVTLGVTDTVGVNVAVREVVGVRVTLVKHGTTRHSIQSFPKHMSANDSDSTTNACRAQCH